MSREHFQIEPDGAGFVLVDCKGTCRTFVGGVLVGGQTRGGTIPLLDGHVIIVGTSRSQFAFTFWAG